MPCGRLVGRFRFRIPVVGTREMWEPVGNPLAIVGGHSLDYAMTIAAASGDVSAVPATALMAAREDDVAEIRKGLGDRLQQIETRMTQISAKLDQRAPAARPSGPDPNRVYTVKYDGAPSKGPAAAPVTIAEFSDFQ